MDRMKRPGNDPGVLREAAEKRGSPAVECAAAADSNRTGALPDYNASDLDQSEQSESIWRAAPIDTAFDTDSSFTDFREPRLIDIEADDISLDNQPPLDPSFQPR